MFSCKEIFFWKFSHSAFEYWDTFLTFKPKMEEGGAEGHQDATTSLILPVIAIVAFLQVRMFLVLYTLDISIAIVIQ